MSIKKFVKTNIWIFKIFFVWRTALFAIAVIALNYIPKLSNSFPYADTILSYTKVPEWVWSFGNFDGVHYLRIARFGYQDEFVQAFFPLFPLLIRFITKFNFILPIEKGIVSPQYIEAQYFQNALIIANGFLLAALFVLYKLFRIDNPKEVSKRSVLLLLCFPTAFFLGSVYSESLFLLLVVLSFYYMRKKEYLYSGIFAALASATRIIGILMFFALFVEIIKNRKTIKILNQKIKTIIGLMIAPLGLISYMTFLQVKFNNFLYFISAASQFGTGREKLPIILLPQVIYRYIKIFFTNTFSISYSISVAEFVFTLVPIVLIILYFKKIRLSYSIFMLGALLIPTLTGTFTSMPRYALMSFLLLPFAAKLPKKYFLLTLIFFVSLQIYFVTLFVRGIWVA